MISRNERKGFLAAHWDWLVVGFGALAFATAVVWFVSSCGTDPEEAAQEDVALLSRHSSRGKIEAIDMTAYAAAMKMIESPLTLVEPSETQGSFLASDRRIFCELGDPDSDKKACNLPIPFGLKVCPFCGAKQTEEVKVSLDSDGDGIPDEQEKKWGMNPNDPADADADADNDGFTNIEEFLAKTDPTDPASHPDYLDSLKVVPPLKETVLPFVFESAAMTPSGIRFVFKDPKKMSDFGKRGDTYRVLANEPIGKTGFVAKSYEKKSRKEKIAGANVLKEVDISTATIERVSDGKKLVLRVQDKRHVAVDVQAKLVYERNGTKEFVVVPGHTINLNGSEYKVTDITRAGKLSKVTLMNANSEKKTIEALEQ